MKYIVVLLLVLAHTAQATDVEREQRWIDQTVDLIFDGIPVFLDAENHRFLGIYTTSDTDSARGMIVLHGTGLHPDWEQVVNPIRVNMTEHGWNTLSIQLPLLEKSATYDDYVTLYPQVPSRLQAATEYLQAQGVSTIVIVAHSQGATMASYYLANFQNEIRALVAIGMSAQHVQPSINSAESLKSISIPVLDIYGSRDFPTVLETADIRRQGSDHNTQFKQVVIPDAYHFFDDSNHERQLLEKIASWLNEQLP